MQHIKEIIKEYEKEVFGKDYHKNKEDYIKKYNKYAIDSDMENPCVEIPRDVLLNSPKQMTLKDFIKVF